ncbi:MAG: hypothetical protein NTX50_14285 [Candidatus Sumerlaeota bacterium]|nr:hypothetical protein [Candidatus Sumerlaeota bacterium]
MTIAQLGRLLGHRELGSMLLNGKRSLSKAHIQKLCAHFSVSPALFLPPTDNTLHSAPEPSSIKAHQDIARKDKPRVKSLRPVACVKQTPAFV